MALPVVQSYSSTATNTNSSSVIVTKPTGLAVGDLMVAFISFFHAGSSGQGINTPAGWTGIIGVNESRVVFSALYKVADASDVAASNFTFTFTTTVDQSAGSIHRIDNFVSGNIIGASELDSSNAPADAILSFTATSTPVSSNSLYLLGFAYAATSIGSNFSASSFTTTPSITLTEDVDVSVQEGGGAGNAHGQAVASGTLTGINQITQYGCTLNQTPSRAEIGILVIINGSYSDTATATFMDVTPVVTSPVGANSCRADTEILNITPEILNSRVTNSSDRTQWTNETKPTATTWTNQDK